MRTLTASDRSALIRLASSLPAGSPERKAILAGLRGSSKKAMREPHPGKYRVTRERYGIPQDLGLMDLHLLSAQLDEADNGDSYMIRKYGKGDTITIYDPADPYYVWTWVGNYEWELSHIA